MSGHLQRVSATEGLSYEDLDAFFQRDFSSRRNLNSFTVTGQFDTFHLCNSSIVESSF